MISGSIFDTVSAPMHSHTDAQRFRRVALLLLTVACLHACSTRPAGIEPQVVQILQQSSRPFGERPQIPGTAEVHALTPAQAREFLDFFNNPALAGEPAFRRLYFYLEGKVQNFTYRNETLAASAAFASNSGNCLSLAIMTTALADLVNVPIEYELVDDNPVYEQHGIVIEKGLHVRTLLFDAHQSAGDGFVFGNRGIAIDYFPTRAERFVKRVSLKEYQAMYYRNRAAEAMRSDDLRAAYWHTMESLRLSPASAESLNMLAVVNRRAGDADTAEQIYLFAIAHSDEKLSLLKNYRILLSSQGRGSEAALIEQQLQQMDDRSPFNWLHLARSAQSEGDLTRAIAYFQKALELAPYLHEAHLGVAMAYYELGALDAADSALRMAIDSTTRNSARQLYKGKLAALSREQH